MNIVIAGGSGLTGTRLCELLLQKGYSVFILTRNKNKQNNFPAFEWNPISGYVDENAFLKCDCIINLAGAGIADKAWTKKRKKEIIDSRVKSSQTIFEALNKIKHNVSVFICASAVGVYEKNTGEMQTETSAVGNDFLAAVTKQWETAAMKTFVPGIRIIVFRTGLVLSGKGGVLKKMLLPFRFGLGVYFGNGNQMYSWIHIDDYCRMVIHAIENKTINGIYNAVSPNAVTNKNLIRTIASVKGGFHLFLPVSSFLLKLIIGKRAELVLDSIAVSAAKIEKEDFTFLFPDIKTALNNILCKSSQ